MSCHYYEVSSLTIAHDRKMLTEPSATAVTLGSMVDGWHLAAVHRLQVVCYYVAVHTYKQHLITIKIINNYYFSIQQKNNLMIKRVMRSIIY